MTTRNKVNSPAPQDNSGFQIFSREQEPRKCTVPVNFQNDVYVNLTIESLTKVVKFAMLCKQGMNIKDNELHVDDIALVMDLSLQLIPFAELKAWEEMEEEVRETQKALKDGNAANI